MNALVCSTRSYTESSGVHSHWHTAILQNDDGNVWRTFRATSNQHKTKNPYIEREFSKINLNSKYEINVREGDLYFSSLGKCWQFLCRLLLVLWQNILANGEWMSTLILRASQCNLCYFATFLMYIFPFDGFGIHENEEIPFLVRLACSTCDGENRFFLTLHRVCVCMCVLCWEWMYASEKWFGKCLIGLRIMAAFYRRRFRFTYRSKKSVDYTFIDPGKIKYILIRESFYVRLDEKTTNRTENEKSCENPSHSRKITGM